MFTLQIARVLVRTIDRDDENHRRKAEGLDHRNRATAAHRAATDLGQQVPLTSLR